MMNGLFFNEIFIFYRRMVRIFIDKFSELCSVERGSIWQIAFNTHYRHTFYKRFFSDFPQKFTYHGMMTRSYQGILGWLRFGWPTHCDPRGFHDVEVFQSFFTFVQNTSIYVRSLPRANQKRTTNDSAASTVSHSLSTLNSPDAVQYGPMRVSNDICTIQKRQQSEWNWQLIRNKIDE